MKQTSWWQERVVGGLSSYWVYQHIGNLSPQALADDGLYQKVREHDGDCEPMLRDFATAADKEADGRKGAQWSYRRDLGDVRLLVIDSRCGRMLDEGNRQMISDARVRVGRGAGRGRVRPPAGRHLAAVAARARPARHRGLERDPRRRQARDRGWHGSRRSSAGPPTSSTGRPSASPSTGSRSSSPASAAATTPAPAASRRRRCACSPATCTTRTPRRPTTTTTRSGRRSTS